MRSSGLGFAYLWVLLMIAAAGAGAAATAQVWSTAAQRDREAELLFAGDQYARAIASYVEADPSRALPRRFEDLLRDARTPTVRRHLRRLYRDPITGSSDWGIVLSGGGIVGVFSRSTARPFKRSGFKERHAHFATASQYAEWKFVAELAAGAPGPAAAGGTANPPAAGVAQGAPPPEAPVVLTPVGASPAQPAEKPAATAPVKPASSATARTAVERQCRLIARADAGTCAAMRSSRGDAVAARCEQSAADRASTCVEARAFQGAMPSLVTE